MNRKEINQKVRDELTMKMHQLMDIPKEVEELDIDFELSIKGFQFEVVPSALINNWHNLLDKVIDKTIDIVEEEYDINQPDGWKLPDDMRELFKEPLGPIIQTEDLNEKIDPYSQIFTVGDVVTKTIQDTGFQIKLAAIDGKTKRNDKIDWKSLIPKGYDMVACTNPAGHIVGDLMTYIKGAINSSKNTIIFVEGEEDLAVIPVILHAPLGSQILYGVPDEGMCLFIVTKEIRHKANVILNKMEAYGGRK